MNLLESINDYQNITEDEFFIFKHSSTCSKSKMAHTEITNYSNHHSIPIFKLIVQDSRELSNFLAETYSIQHESPQIFYIKSKKVIFQLHHLDITKDALEKNTPSQ